MILLDAKWEQRNLGLNTVEITIEEHDKIDPVISLLTENLFQFFVIKLPPYRFDLIYPLQELGFTFNEVIYSCRHLHSSSTKITKLEEKYLEKLSFSKMSDIDIKTLNLKLDDHFFLTDRISINPHFGSKIALKRYLGLIFDELENGAEIVDVKYKAEKIGFFLIKNNLKYSISNLGVIYREYQGRGFGFFLNYFQILYSKKMKVLEHRTSYSSNNFIADKIHRKLNFEVFKYYSVFSKLK